MNEGTLSRELRLPGLGLVMGDPIHGYVMARTTRTMVDITRLGVVPELQGRGLGKRLLGAVLEQVAVPVMLTVSRRNHRALALYHTAGFQIVGQIEHSWAMVRPASSLADGG